jgi:sulfatase modifying factor 1
MPALPAVVVVLLLLPSTDHPAGARTPSRAPSQAAVASGAPGAPLVAAAVAPSTRAPLDDPAARLAPEAALPPAPPCPDGMVLVDGQYCPSLKQVCVRWVDPPDGPYGYTRCAEFKRPAACEGEREHRRYCIDRDEYVRPPEALPLVHLDWDQAEATCEERGARLCAESEWELACEGDEMLPYPYGYGRDPTACNFDRTDLGKMGEGLTDHRAPLDAFPQCVSPFGVHDMVGNVDEWTRREGMTAPNRSALHGGWWLPGRNNCRAATLAHPESYSGKQVGFRCCADAKAPAHEDADGHDGVAAKGADSADHTS